MSWYRSQDFAIPFSNKFLRLALRIHFLLARIIVMIRGFGKSRKIDQWYKETKVFFVLGSKRSGTKFFADFLNQALVDGLVQHEAIADDYWDHPKARQSEEDALQYIESFRRQEIYCRVEKTGAKIYGEVNPFLRRHVIALQKAIPEATCIHVTRDPRDVVRSLMSKLYQGPKDPTTHLIYPLPEDEYFDKWSDMDRFARICWIWKDDNEYLRKNCSYHIKFEELRSNYGYFKKQFLDYLDLSIDEDIWQSFVNKPRNHTPKFLFPDFQIGRIGQSNRSQFLPKFVEMRCF